MWRLIFLANCGQHLINEMKESREGLEDFSLDFQIDSKQQQGLDVLDRRLDNPAPISPYSIFSVSHSSLLATFSVLLTYIIVLLQFKTSGT